MSFTGELLSASERDSLKTEIELLRLQVQSWKAEYDTLKHEVERLQCDTGATNAENRELRIMLAIAHAGLALYTDDGELQDNRMHPLIDFKRDSAAEIERKLHERAYARMPWTAMAKEKA